MNRNFELLASGRRVELASVIDGFGSMAIALDHGDGCVLVVFAIDNLVASNQDLGEFGFPVLALVIGFNELGLSPGLPCEGLR